MRHRRTLAMVGMGVIALQGCAAIPHHSRAEVLPHFFQVDANLYRGGQPTAEGFRSLSERGIKTVIDLRAEHSFHRRQEQRLVESLGMQWEYLPMRSYWRPSPAQVEAFLKIVTDPQRQPVFIHCRKGEDRAGVLVAVYRVVEQGWEPRQAYAEARSLGLAAWNPLLRAVIFNARRRDANTAIDPR